MKIRKHQLTAEMQQQIDKTTEEICQARGFRGSGKARTSGAGKGDSPRPVNGQVYRSNFDKIFKK